MAHPVVDARSDPAARQSLAGRLVRRTDDAFVAEERRGLMLAAKVRMIGIAVILLWQAVDSPDNGLSYAYALVEIGSFGILGLLQYFSAKYGFYPGVLKFVFVLIDCVLLAVILSVPDPFESTPIPPAVVMDGSRFTYFFLFLMQAAFSFRPHLVLWCGFCIVAARTGMLLWLLMQPGVFTNLDLSEQTAAAFLAARPDPNFLFLGYWATEIIVTLLVAAGFATLVRRSRRLVESSAIAERTRASLARYFSPNMVDHLSGSEDLLEDVREQNVAVLFADIMSFTKMCEKETADSVVGLLREYHDRLGRAVFENGGTLDKYIGDGLMATFGTPRPGPQDARNALKCAVDMIAELDRWNEERTASGAPPVLIGIGLHYGEVIAGNIGNERRLEYSVIGDTVNIASRLEHLTRSLNTPLVVSDSLIKALAPSDDSDGSLLSNLVECGTQTIRGRDSGVAVWIYKEADSQ